MGGRLLTLWAGVALDPVANAAHATRIWAPTSGVDVRVLPTDEEAVIARHTARELGLGPTR